jgi:hypothetical protein
MRLEAHTRLCLGLRAGNSGISRRTSEMSGTRRFFARLGCKELAPSGHEMWMESGCAVPWATASEPLNDEQQNQLKGNRPADINANIDGRTRPARQEALMVFIETGDHQGAKNRQHRGAPPETPVFDGHAMKRLSPAVEKSETDQSVTDEVAGLADEMMYLLPVCRARRTKEMYPERIEPSAGVRR